MTQFKSISMTYAKSSERACQRLKTLTLSNSQVLCTLDHLMQTLRNPKWLCRTESPFQIRLIIHAMLNFLKSYRTEQNFTGHVLRSCGLWKVWALNTFIIFSPIAKLLLFAIQKLNSPEAKPLTTGRMNYQSRAAEPQLLNRITTRMARPTGTMQCNAKEQCQGISERLKRAALVL